MKEIFLGGYRMEHLINKRVKSIEISGIRKFSNMVAELILLIDQLAL